MRLWHEKLISELPRQQLLGQHRECCALRGNGWGKPHSTVNYIFQYPPYMLFNYHEKVMNEMESRGYNVNPLWKDPTYRGLSASNYSGIAEMKGKGLINSYPEHTDQYLRECLDNLSEKGIEININF
ncbi:TIGR02328 family protein [Virgibacillus flavescens]|uniref:TIGR02328 family protein n=1 Tax=Virgibacillus flavescens TaxID=1611422 RepID=UPI003D3347B1